MEEHEYSTYQVRCRAVTAVLNGWPASTVAETYSVHRGTVYRWLARYREEDGVAGLTRRPVSGRPRKLAELTEKELEDIVLSPASRFGYETDFWTSRRLVQVIEKETGVRVSIQTMWRRLREMDLTYQKPERRYAQADDEERRRWLEEDLPRIKEVVSRYHAVLYFEDECSVSLTPILAKTWAPRGQTPVQKVTGTRGSISAMSAISKSGGLIFSLHEKRIASDEVIHFLSEMLRHHKRRHIVVVMDQASPHTSKKTKAFVSGQKRLHVFYLPPYSPDFNPDEWGGTI